MPADQGAPVLGGVNRVSNDWTEKRLVSHRPPMLRLHVVVLVAFFAYLVTFVSGCPKHRQGEPVRIELRNDKDAPRESPKMDSGLRVVWGAGLLERVLLQRRALSELNDPLLESDSRPERLLRSLERSLTADIVMLALALMWGLLLLTTLAALRRAHWFYRPMLLMVLGPLLLAVLLVLLNVRRLEIIDADRAGLLFRDWLLLMRVYIEAGLFLGGSAVFLSRLLPESGGLRLDEEKFMGHMRPVADPERRLRTVVATVTQVATIIAAALAVANFVLFPLYVLQISFPRFFAALLGALLVGLSVFYVRAYVRVSRSQEAQGGQASGAAFLGFRLLRNTLFVTAAATLVILTVSVIVVITMLNIDLLQSVQLLQRPQSL